MATGELAQLDPDSAGRTFDDADEWDPPGLQGCRVEIEKFRWQEELTVEHLRSRLATHSVYAVMAETERKRSLDELAAVATRETVRTGSPVVVLDHLCLCARVQI